MTTPTTPPAVSEAMREAVARIIDPVSFAYTPEDFGFSGEDDPAWERSGGYDFRDPAIKKADAILSGPIASEIARLTGERDAATQRAEKLLAEGIQWRDMYRAASDWRCENEPALVAAEADLTRMRAETERLEAQLRGAREFIANHPSLTQIDRAEFRAFLAVPAAFAALSNPEQTDA